MRQAVHEPIESPTGPNVNLIRSFNLALRGMNRSPKTQETYLEATRQFVAFMEDRGCPPGPRGGLVASLKTKESRTNDYRR